VARLRKAIRSAEESYKALGDDPLITSAIPIAAPKATLEPTQDLTTYSRRLPVLEKLVAPRP
jgi:hypothetical protein